MKIKTTTFPTLVSRAARAAAFCLFFAAWLPSLVSGSEAGPGYLYVKNNNNFNMFVWVNGQPQGIAYGGRVSFMPREGFVTQGSGIQPDGELRVEHAFGGWDPRGRSTIDVRLAGVSRERDAEGKLIVVKADIPNVGYAFDASLRSAAVWVGEGSPVTRGELEFSGKMGEGRPPAEVSSSLSLATKTPPESFKGIRGGVAGGASFAGQWTGQDAEEEAAEGNFTVSGLGIEMVWIAPGTFVMGSPASKPGRDGDEGPQTTVRLTRGYWLGKTPVTQGQWQALMGNNPSHFKGANLPVERVSWDEAMAFCRRLTERERAAGRLPAGYAYTLPSEAQWEYAARAGTTTRWSFGNNEGALGQYAWFDGNSGSRTHPVGQKGANPWGLHDVHGNVFEWTRSWYGNYPGGSVTDYEGPASGSVRVIRGGSWGVVAAYTRSALRSGRAPVVRFYLGFRLALSSVR